MRSSLFITLSVVVHVVCVTALAIGHFKKKQPEQLQVTAMEGGVTETTVVANDPVQSETVKTMSEKTTSLNSKTVAKKQPNTKTTAEAKVSPVTELPEKVVQQETLDPQIDDAETVAVAAVDTTPTETEQVEMVPVKETVAAGVEAEIDETEIHTEDAQTEAVSSDAQATGDPTPSEVANVAQENGDQAGADAPKGDQDLAGKGGETKSSAVSHLNLKQAAGNKPPTYPLSARLENRQGIVGLIYRVTKDGFVENLQIAKSSGFQDLDQAALKAVEKFRYVPGQEGWARHPVMFSLKGSGETMPSRLRSKDAQAN